MSTYLPGITDYLPTLQPFRPDLNFYANVLQTRQSQYDSNYKQISGLYGTLLNSPLTRDENIERRDKFFNTINQDIKKISGMDLSRQENVDTASKIFDPLIKDPYITKDMAWTRNFQGQMQRAESLRLCTDPEKCGGSYWDTGMKALQYQQEEFKNAGADESLRASNPKYTAFHNLTKEAVKAAKDSGFNITIDSKKGGYIVTDTNGNMLLNSPGQGKGGILPTYLAGLFKDDQRFKDVFNAQAYVARKDFSRSNAMQYGSESAAESAYISNIINRTAPEMLTHSEQVKASYDEAEAKLNVLNDKVGQSGMVNNSSEQSAIQGISQLLQSKPAADAYHENVINTVESVKNITDINQLRNIADNLVSNNQFMGTLQQSAEDYALGTQTRSIKADPFAISKYSSDLSLRNSIATAEKGFEIWQRKQQYDNVNTSAFLQKLGINPAEVKGMSPKQIEKYIEQKGGAAENTATGTPAIGWQTGKATTNTYDENSKNTYSVIQNMNQGTDQYLKSTADAMRASYISLKSSTDPKAKDKMLLLENNLQSIFEGTGFNAMDYISGNVNADAISRISPEKRASAYGKAYKVSDDPSSYYWVDGYKPTLDKIKGSVDKDIQVFNQTTALTKQGGLDTKNSMLGSINMADTTPENITKSLVINSMVDENGHLIDRETAKVNFAKRVWKPGPNGAVSVFGGTDAGDAIGKKATQSFIDFNNVYDGFAEEFKTGYKGKNFTGQAGSDFEGGSKAVAGSQSRYVNPATPYSENAQFANSVVSTILDNAGTGNMIVFGGKQNTPVGLESDPEKETFATTFLNKYREDLGKKDKEGKASFTMTAQRVPESKVPTGAGTADVFDIFGTNYNTFAGGNLYKITPSPEAVKKLVGAKLYDANKDYSFTSWVKDGVDNSEFAQKNKLTVSQGLMNIPGQSLNYDDVNLGSFSIRTDANGQKWTSMKAKQYDPQSNSWVTTSAPEELVTNTDVDVLWNEQQETLRQYRMQQLEKVKQTQGR